MSDPAVSGAAPGVAAPEAPVSTATPGDSPEAPPPAAAVKRPTAGNRYEVFDDGQGNYRVYQLADAAMQKTHQCPPGTLFPIQEIAGFSTNHEVRSFLRKSGDLLNGKQFMVIRAIDIGSVDVATVTKAKLNWKPKKAVKGPAQAEATGA